MMFVVSEELRYLSELFNKKKSCLYIVGGYVRNKIIGIPDNQNLDIDLCSKSTPDEISLILKNTYFEIQNVDNNFGVVKIKGKDSIYEHATFRTEKYDFAGAHNPSNVEFVDSLEIDAVRRDFRCNSIYYDIYKDEIIDPFDGVKDVKNRIIKTTRRPEVVFNDDSERILRMVRQASTLGFRIDKRTFESAKSNAFKIKYLSKQRLKNEFEQILLADHKYANLKDTKYAHARGIELLGELGVLKYILPLLGKIYDIDIIEDRGRNLFSHIIDTFKICKEPDVELRLAVLVHDYGKAEAMIENNNFSGCHELADIHIEKELGSDGLMYNKKTVNNIKQIVECQDFNNHGLTSKAKIRMFIIKNYMQIYNILLLKKYILINKFGKLSFGFKRLFLETQNVVDGKYPKSVKELDVSATDIIDDIQNIRRERITELLNKLLFVTIRNHNKNTKSQLLKQARKIINKNKVYYLEV